MTSELPFKQLVVSTVFFLFWLLGGYVVLLSLLVAAINEVSIFTILPFVHKAADSRGRLPEFPIRRRPKEGTPTTRVGGARQAIRVARQLFREVESVSISACGSKS